MKKIIVIALAVFSLGIITANADNDRLTVKESLPKKAQQFIDTYFKSEKITYVKDERDYLERSYEVLFADGTKVEFNRNGEWKEIDCRSSSVPAAIVPAQITKYVNENYPNVKILQIERDRVEYELLLSNRLELAFNKKFKIVDIDN
ncbi:MAG: hypothetical protein E7089_09640 [Bacteroidales bacterium]|nr:hypothetical protein [Bacteroidales bacterium]MBR2607495.1 PepSY-like domain-containing protein [Bacteroidaceae bacterium]